MLNHVRIINPVQGQLSFIPFRAKEGPSLNIQSALSEGTATYIRI